MMNRTHALSGAVAYVALADHMAVTTNAELAAGALLAAVAATLPDIDSNSSIPSKLIVVPLWRVLPHRGVTHYLLTWLVLQAAVLYFFGSHWWTEALILGWLMHQLGDLITVQGLRWLWPLPFTLRGFIHAGGWVERWPIFFGLIAFAVWRLTS